MMRWRSSGVELRSPKFARSWNFLHGCCHHLPLEVVGVQALFGTSSLEGFVFRVGTQGVARRLAPLKVDCLSATVHLLPIAA